jgi:hypothetical protein
MTLPEIDLPKVAGVAGSAVGLIIATTIMLSWVTARYVPASDRYRALTGELRGFNDHNRRRQSLRGQIEVYRRRLLAMSRACCLLCWVMVCAVATILLASVAIALPPEHLPPGGGEAMRWVSAAGAATLAVALLLDLGAVGCAIYENRIDRRAIDDEVMDIDEVSGGEAAARAAGAARD